MPNTLKGLVSKKKIRFQKDGFDLDLTYITNRIIAMGYPAQSLEGIYRNHIDDVVRCNERHIDEQKFEPFTINHSYPFDDHNPPRFSQMIKCCEGIKSYLDQDSNNIVAIQCKAGKGRTGVIVCSYLLFTGHCQNATDVLHFYGRSRTTNGKGVTIPSQIRYIYYLDHLLHHNLTYKHTTLKLNCLILDELPNIAGNGYEVQVVVHGYDKYDNMRQYYSSQFYDIKKDGQRSLKLCAEENWILHGDIKFQIIYKSKYGKKGKLCHCWLNTFFVVNKPFVPFPNDTSHRITMHYNSMRKSIRTASTLPERPKQTYMIAVKDNLSSTKYNNTSHKLMLRKPEIDKANKDVNNKIFPPNFTKEPRCKTHHVSSSNDCRQCCLSKMDLIDRRDTSVGRRNHCIHSKDDHIADFDDMSVSSESSTKRSLSGPDELIS